MGQIKFAGRRQRQLLFVALCVTAVVAAGSLQFVVKVQGQARATTVGDLPKPRHPRPATKKITSVEDLMPYARALARYKAATHGVGLGALEPGDSALLIGDITSSKMAVDAVLRALTERKVRAEFKADYEMVGVTRDEMLAYQKATGGATSEPTGGWSIAEAEHGYSETASWVREIRDETGKSAGEAWLKDKRSDLYAKLFPRAASSPAAIGLPPELEAVRKKLRGTQRNMNPIARAVLDYVNKNNMRGAFWGNGGPIWIDFAPHEDKWLGIFTQDQIAGLVHEMPQYPSDVWTLAEEKTIDSLGYLDRVEVKDPEGTDASFDLTAEQAKRWALAVFQRAHLYLFPNQGFGRNAQAIIGHGRPVELKEWVQPEPLVLLNGVLAGIRGHGGFYPRMELHYKDGYLKEVKGGGVYGEVLREFLNNYPGINDAVLPFYKKPGYFYHYEFALGTQSKAPWALETRRAGIFHFGIGKEIRTDPDSGRGYSTKYENDARKHKVPGSHGWHMHNYFLTYKGRVRGSNRWVTLNDRGRVTALDSPEARALASKYGNPDEVLREDWIPEVPGINMPGDYQAYSADPYKHHKGSRTKSGLGRTSTSVHRPVQRPDRKHPDGSSAGERPRSNHREYLFRRIAIRCLMPRIRHLRTCFPDVQTTLARERTRPFVLAQVFLGWVSQSTDFTAAPVPDCR